MDTEPEFQSTSLSATQSRDGTMSQVSKHPNMDPVKGDTAESTPTLMGMPIEVQECIVAETLNISVYHVVFDVTHHTLDSRSHRPEGQLKLTLSTLAALLPDALARPLTQLSQYMIVSSEVLLEQRAERLPFQHITPFDMRYMIMNHAHIDEKLWYAKQCLECVDGTMRELGLEGPCITSPALGAMLARVFPEPDDLLSGAIQTDE